MADTTLKQRVHDAKQDVAGIAAALDAMDHAARVAAIRSLSRRDQAVLYERVTGRACVLDRDFVPAGTPPLTEVIHEGKNSLPLFSRFQKRFCAPSAAGTEKVAWGYNEQALKVITGPGYFVAREAASEAGVRTVVVDYTAELPTEKPAHWPKILPNSARLSRFVYYGTQDWMWRVSRHVTIGRARRASGWMDNWFVLCRP